MVLPRCPTGWTHKLREQGKLNQQQLEDPKPRPKPLDGALSVTTGMLPGMARSQRENLVYSNRAVWEDSLEVVQGP